jgi:hypothetical protein
VQWYPWYRWLCRALVLTLSLGGTGRAGETATASTRELVAALRSGGPVILVIARSAPGKPTDEAYGDWADALNNFAAHAEPRVKIIKVTAPAYRLAIADPTISGPFATLFVRDLDHALLYRGMILEPQVYHLGQGFILEQVEPSRAAAYGLTPTTIRLRRGKIGTSNLFAPGLADQDAGFCSPGSTPAVLRGPSVGSTRLDQAILGSAHCRPAVHLQARSSLRLSLIERAHYSLAPGSTNSLAICSSPSIMSRSVRALPSPSKAISSTPASR